VTLFYEVLGGYKMCLKIVFILTLTQLWDANVHRILSWSTVELNIPLE